MGESQFPKGVEVTVGAIVKNDQNQILAVKSVKWPEKWGFPGGHIEPGESMFKTAAREVLEETGLVVKPVEVVTTGEMIDSIEFHRKAHFVYVVVLCVLTQKQEPSLDMTELIEYRWCTIAEALDLPWGGPFGEAISLLVR